MHPYSTIPATSGIYKITCIITNRLYVGSALNLRRRWIRHRNDLLRNEHPNPKLQAAWNKYGPEAFIYEIIEIVLIPELLTAREQHFFDVLKPFGKKGFNILTIAGTSLGRKATPEQRLAQSNNQRASEATKQAMREAQTGRKHSPETKIKIGLATAGHTVSPEGRIRIGDVHRGKPSTFRGKHHSAQSRERMNLAHDSEMKTIIVISPDGIPHTVHGIRKFCRENALDRSALHRVAQGKQRTHKGWTARYPDIDAS